MIRTNFCYLDFYYIIIFCLIFTATNETPIKNENCTPAAIEQFPRPFIPDYIRKEGAIAIHIIVTLYSFLALAVVCDEYFVPALECLCDGELNYSTWISCVK